MPLIEGTDGLVQVGPSSALTTVGYVTDFSVDCKTDINQRGPYIGNATISKTRKAKTSSGSLSVDLVGGTESGRKKLIEAHENGTDIRLVLIGGDGTNKGLTYTAPNAGLAGVKFAGKADEGYTAEFSFEDMDGYTLVETP